MRVLALAVLLAAEAVAQSPRVPHKVLFVGDSHSVGYFGLELDALLRAAGASVTTRALCGSAPRDWLEGRSQSCGWFFRDPQGASDRELATGIPKAAPSLGPILDSQKPDLVVIALGANMTGSAEDSIRSQSWRLAALVTAAGARCVWVGPPRRRDETGQAALYEALRGAVYDHCIFVDSRELTRYPATGGDGRHYWGAEGERISKEWAAAVLGRLGL
jgi:hypothetical protein